ncbi:nuclear transport factor 2 family protein [uncultured Aquimarina sp.]|uniref:nuclear transport factor 2 family protein n=1 Tax=uncultured Aquimarina sp. TaxID=575652 RepID=UPI00260F1D75|nr:nuclear transport factor 2 family protein [uncultured Aquimarina sp.]
MKYSEESNLSVLKDWYKSAINGEGEKVANTLSDAIKWHFAEGLGVGGDYQGKETLLRDVLPEFFSEFDKLQGFPSDFKALGNLFIVKGTYIGKTKEAQKDFSAEFMHIIEMKDGKITSLYQNTNTDAYTKALGEVVIQRMDDKTKPFRV